MWPKILLLYLLTCTFSVMAYDKPNSITWDPITKSYFISNLEGKSITKLDSNFNKTDVITGLIRPKDLLFASFGPYNGLLILDSNEVKVYDADSYTFITSLPVSGAMDLEDAEADKLTGGIFYITDPEANIIFKVVVGPAPFYTPVFTVLNSTVRRPKALLYDSKNRLLVTSDTLKSPVYSVNTSSGNASLITNTPVDYINSLEEDLEGNYYATSWGDSYVYRLDKNFKNAAELALYSKPTGLFFNQLYDVIVIACSNCNKVEFYKLHMVYLNDSDTAKCPGDSFYVNASIQFKGKGTYNTGNIFYAELSDGSGKFNSPLIIATYKTVKEPDSYKVVLPKGRRFSGNNYKIRIRSTSPAFYSLNAIETVVPYVPLISVSSFDSLFFCSPASFSFGVKKDMDSGFVNYLWFENGKKISNDLPTYTHTFTIKTKVELIKSPVSGKCSLKDSILLIPSTVIQIPFKDSIYACEKSLINVGGDSISNTKIEWTSKNYPKLRTEFNPLYQLNSNDTFLVKVTSLTGFCSSQKTIYAFSKTRPDYQAVNDNLINCNINKVSFGAQYIKGDIKNLIFKWEPETYLSGVEIEKKNFYTSMAGVFKYKFIAMDTVYRCYDSVLFSIKNVETPVQPVLADNSKGMVIKNYNPNYTYKWYKDNIFKAQTTSDSQFVLPNGESKWGIYKVIVTNTDSVDCSDTSELFELRDPASAKKPETEGVLIFPNPATDKLIVKKVEGNLMNAEIVISDFMGRTVLAAKPTSGDEINIESLLPGMYSVRINFEGRILIARFVKK